MQSGVRTKPVPQGFITPLPRGDERLAWSAQTKRPLWKQDRGRRRREELAKRTALQNDFTLQIQLQRQMDFPARLESKL